MCIRDREGTGKSATQAGRRMGDVSSGAEKIRREISALPAMLRNLSVALGAAFSVREVARAAEAYTTIGNRLALVTRNAQELADAQEDVYKRQDSTGANLADVSSHQGSTAFSKIHIDSGLDP